MFLPNQSPKGPVRGVRNAAVVIATAFLIQASQAHEGHDHGDAAGASLVTTALPRIAADSEQYEIVGILKNGRLTITIDDKTTNEPVTSAKLKVTVGDGEPVDAEPTSRGTYAVAFNQPGRTGSVDVVFNVTGDTNDDLLVGLITPNPDTTTNDPAQSPPTVVGGGFGLGAWLAQQLNWGSRTAKLTSPSTLSDAPRRLPDGSLFVAKPTQRLLEVRTVSAKLQTETPAVKLIGRVIGDPNRSSVVQSLHGGRIIALDAGLPRIGQVVSKGAALVKIDPYLPQADRTTIAEKTGEIEQLIAVAEMRIRRLRPLAERGAVPQSQVNDLETELEGLKLRRDAVRNSRTELEVLIAQSDGIVSVAKVVPGQVVQAQDLLFQIVDPKGLWVEALAYGDLDVGSVAGASALAANGQNMLLKYEGFSPALQQHATVLRFSIPEPPVYLSIGQPLTVLASAGKPVTGIILRRDAVVRSANGESIVWVHTGAERFEARAVRTQPFDATRFIVMDGLAENERIVVRGAELINQIR